MEKLTEPLRLPSILSKFGITNRKTHKEITQIDFFEIN